MVAAPFWFTEPSRCSKSDSWQLSSTLSLSCSTCGGSWQPASSLFLCCNRCCGSWLLPLSSLLLVLCGSWRLPSSLSLCCSRCCESLQTPSSLSLSLTGFCRLLPYVRIVGRAGFSAQGVSVSRDGFSAPGVSVPLVARSRRRSSILWRPKDRKRSPVAGGLTAGDSARLSSVFYNRSREIFTRYR
jgi:hypothetical protein